MNIKNVLLAIVLAAVAVTCKIDGPGQTGPENPIKQTITITINGTNGQTLTPLTLEDGKSGAVAVSWREAYKDNVHGWTAAATGVDKAFTRPTALLVNFNGGESMQILSAADRDKIIGEIRKALTAGNITVSAGPDNHNITIGNYPVVNPVSQNVTITIANCGDAFNQTVADGGSYHFTIAVDGTNKGGIQSWGDPVVTTSAGDFTEGQRPTITIKAEGSSVTVPQADLDKIDDILKKVAADLEARKVNVINQGRSGIALEPVDDVTGFGNGMTGKLTVPATGNARLDITVPMDITDIPAVNSLTLSGLTNANGKDIDVNFTTPSGDKDISLAYVHYLRQTVQNAVGADRTVTINAPTDNFTPVFDGYDWWNQYPWEYDTFIGPNLYGQYSANETLLMDGIKVLKNSSDKYVIEYDRDLKVSRPVWQKGEYSWDLIIIAPFDGFGLSKKTGSNAKVLSHPENFFVVGGSSGESSLYSNPWQHAVVDNWDTYDAALKAAGLHLSDGVFLNHSRVFMGTYNYPELVELVVSDPNAATNGMYDFIIPYFNEDKGDELPYYWYTPSNLVFNGDISLTPGVPERIIGGTTADNPDRKAANGYPNDDYVNNLTVQMADFMKSRMKVTEFRNTNIVGDGSAWENSVINNVLILTTNNVGFIGNYYSLAQLTGKLSGETDITGTIPTGVRQASSREGSLHLWGNVSRETLVEAFNVARISGFGGDKVMAGSSTALHNATGLIIFDVRYTNQPALDQYYRGPNHRAFVGTDGVIKLTGPNNGIDQKYLGAGSTEPVPAFDGLNSATNYATFAAENPTRIWTSQTELNNVPTE